MNINEYPLTIAKLERQILSQTQAARRINETINVLHSKVERAIAFDESLKNDAQRKSRRLELLNDIAEYQDCLDKLMEIQDKQKELEIDLNYYRAQFTIKKLELRDRIAKAELQIQAA
jgi:hypothetical protein